MKNVAVISQPMFLPWIGLFEQIALTEVYIHYDDVQMPQGRSFIPRVQIKTANGILWLTAPIDRINSGVRVNEVLISDKEDWKRKHLKTIQHAYLRAPCFDQMFGIVEEIYSCDTRSLSEFNINAIEIIIKWLGLSPKLLTSSKLGITGSGTERLLNLCKLVEAKTYITGLGALNYLEHERFDDADVMVRYMDYKLKKYVQLHGQFVPYVSIIDGIANCGDKVRDLICSPSVYWREYIHRQG